MSNEQWELLLKAQKSLQAAQLLLANHYLEYVVSRAYYTMFYIAEAFLDGEGLFFLNTLLLLLLSDENLPKPNAFHQTFIAF